MKDHNFIIRALEKAQESILQGGFPAGALIVKKGKIVGEGISIGDQLNDPTSHGEIAAIRDACRNLKTSDLSECILYASMHPCLMCFSACMWSAISNIYYACRKEAVNPAYYGGAFNVDLISLGFNSPPLAA